MQHKKQKATALLTALMLVVIIVASITVIVSSQKVSLYRAKQAQHIEQAFAFALGVETWGIHQIKAYRALPEKQAATIQWPIIMPPLTIENIKVTGEIHELQGLYNLNDTMHNILGFSNLVRYVMPTFSKEDSTTLAQNIVAWQSRSLLPFFNTNVSSNYSQNIPPYRAAYKPFSDKSELLLIHGMTPALYQALEPYITALPEKREWALNINTAQLPALLTLDYKMTETIAESILKERHQQEGFSDKSAFFAIEDVKPLSISPKKITLSSHFFLLRTTVYYEAIQITLNSLFQAKEQQGTTHIVLISRALHA